MTYRILSLDGGGIRGIMTAVILSEVERQLNKPLNQHFDLIAGTSTGSILAAAIATGRKSEEIVQLYQRKGRRIFPYSSRFSLQRLKLILQYGLSAPKYSDEGLISVLKEEFGATKLSDLYDSPQLLIVAYDTLNREPIVFKSWRKDEHYFHVSLWEACVCSASAPVYFPAHLLQTPLRKYSVIDGGVAANNPSACALAEAIRLKNKIEDISVLSIGTGDSDRPIRWENARGWGVSQWIWKGRLIDVLFDASADIHDYITKQVMSEPELENKDCGRYLRLQPEIDKAAMDEASPEHIAKLVGVAQNYVEENKERLKNFIRQYCS